MQTHTRKYIISLYYACFTVVDNNIHELNMLDRLVVNCTRSGLEAVMVIKLVQVN